MEQVAPTELDRLPRWAPFLVMALLTLLAFRQYLLSGPGEMLLGQDTVAAGIMFRKFFVEHIRALGRLPLWNPYLFGGVPTVEAGSGDILYPASILHFLLPLTSALAWKLILHVYLAGVFMYLAARALGLPRYPALFAGSAYLLSTNLGRSGWEDVCDRSVSRGALASHHCNQPPLVGPLYLAGGDRRFDGGGPSSAGILRVHCPGTLCGRQPLVPPQPGRSGTG